MIEAAIPENEEERLRKLHELDILDTIEEEAYDDLTRLAAEICKTPIALVSLVDRKRQWFKSHYGLDVRETPRDVAFCSHAILGDDIFVIEDHSKAPRFADNPLAIDAPYVKFYAGAPLIMSDNYKLGTLCVIANEPRSISDSEKEALKALARMVVNQLELRIKNRELEVLDQAKDEFIAMVSHELRTPLTAVYGSMSLLLNEKLGHLDDKQQDLVSISFRNSKRLLGLVNDILDLAKLESGAIDICKEALDLKVLLEKSAELNKQYCTECNVVLSLDFSQAGDRVMVIGDEERLLQVMCNFLSNAAKFTFAGDKVDICLRVDDAHAVVEVTDHGPGIHEEHKGLLFSKFSQLDTGSNKKLPGTGLGLNISQKIIELHDGKIGFTSLPDVKTTFYFKIPLLRE